MNQEKHSQMEKAMATYQPDEKNPHFSIDDGRAKHEKLRKGQVSLVPREKRTP